MCLGILARRPAPFRKRSKCLIDFHNVKFEFQRKKSFQDLNHSESGSFLAFKFLDFKIPEKFAVKKSRIPGRSRLELAKSLSSRPSLSPILVSFVESSFESFNLKFPFETLCDRFAAALTIGQLLRFLRIKRQNSKFN